MTFESALKRLAEKEPDDLFNKANDVFAFRQDTNNNWIHQFDFDLTQDDIDEILALIGWEYEVGRQWLLVGRGWSVWIRKVNEKVSGEFVSKESSTKLEAAKAALIAVVQKQYPLIQVKP